MESSNVSFNHISPTDVSFLSYLGLRLHIYKHYGYAVLCASPSATVVHKKRDQKVFLKIPRPNHPSPLLRVLTKCCSLTPDKLLFKSFSSLWAEAGFCFIQSDFSLSQDSLIKSVSWLKRGRNEPIHQPRNAAVWPLPKATGKGRNLFNLWGGWQWVMHS